MAPFMPKGDKAQRVIVAELAAQADYGDLLTFETLAAALGVSERDQIRQAVSAAKPLALRDHLKALIAVRGQGYRIARAGEQAGLAQTHRRKADAQIGKALEIVTYADETRMTPEERDRNRAVATVLHIMHQRQVNADDRIARLEAAVERLSDQIVPARPVIPGMVE